MFSNSGAGAIAPLGTVGRLIKSGIRIVCRPNLACDHSGGVTNITGTTTTTTHTSIVLTFMNRRTVLSKRTRYLTSLGLRNTRDRLVTTLTGAKGPIIAIMVTKHPLAVKGRIRLSSTMLCSFRPKAVKKPTLTSLL